jgi:hypothetical protein
VPSARFGDSGVSDREHPRNTRTDEHTSENSIQKASFETSKGNKKE